MSTTLYRDSDVRLAQWTWEARMERDALRSMPPLRRAIMSCSARRELDALALRLDAALAEGLSLHGATTLADDVARLRAARARAEAEVSRAQDDARRVPPPPPSERERELARFENEGVGLSLVGQPSGALRVLRARIPRGPTFTLRVRTLSEFFRPPRGAISLDPEMDETFVVKGEPFVADELLDPTSRRILFAMSEGGVTLSVVDGVVALAWRAEIADAFFSDALYVVTTIAKRLHEA